MPKTFACRDAGGRCDFQTTQETEDEILAAVQEHAGQHHLKTTDRLEEVVREATVDVEPPPLQR